MKILVVGSKTTFLKTITKYQQQIDTTAQFIYTEDHTAMAFKLIASEHTHTIYVVSPIYYAVKSLLNYALILKATTKPNLNIYCLIGDVRVCNHGYVAVNTFEDTVTFNDKSIEYRVQQELNDIYYRTRQLINQYHPPMDYITSPSFDQQLQAYDIELTTQLIPYLKMNVWHTTEDYRAENGIQDKDRFIVHNEERYAYRNEVTLLDRIMAWITLNTYKKLSIPPLHRVVTNGKDYKVINLATQPLQDLSDEYYTTPMYADVSDRDCNLPRLPYILPRSECGQLKKVGAPATRYNMDISDNFMI